MPAEFYVLRRGAAWTTIHMTVCICPDVLLLKYNGKWRLVIKHRDLDPQNIKKTGHV